MPNPTCETCRFWDRINRRDGECHRFPPAFITVMRGVKGTIKPAFPTMHNLNWCGEHQPTAPKGQREGE